MAFTLSPAPQLRKAISRRLMTSAAFAGILGASAASVMLGGRLSAQPLNAALIPADTHWLIYINSDELVKTGMAKKLASMAADMRKFAPHPDVHMKQQQGKMKQFWNAICNDSHDILVYGAVVGHKRFVMQLHVNPATFHPTVDLQSHDTGKTLAFHGITIRKMHPDGPGHTFYLAQPAAGDVLMTHDSATMKSALKFQDGKHPSLPAGSPLIANINTGTIFYAAATGFDGLPKHAHVPPFVRGLHSVSLAASATNARTAHLHVAIAATNTAAAENMYKMVEGGLAMAEMMGQSQTASPEAKLHAMMLSTLKLKRKGQNISATWALPMDMLEQSIQDRMKMMRDSHWQHWKRHQGNGPGPAPGK